MFLVAGRQWKRVGATLFCCLALWLVSARLAWSYSTLTVIVGIAFVPALAMAVSGQFPLVLESLTVGLLSMFRGADRISSGAESHLAVDDLPTQSSPPLSEHVSRDHETAKTQGNVWSIALPVIAALAFASIFVLANPICISESASSCVC